MRSHSPRAAIALVTAILLIPTPLRIQGTLVLRLAKPEEIYAQVEGRLVEMPVKNGEWVKKDTVLAKLGNPQKEKELSERQQDYNINWHKAIWFGQGSENEDRAQAKQHKEFAEKLEKVIAEINRESRQADSDLRIATARSSVRLTASTSASGSSRAKHSARSATRTHLEAHLLLDQSDIHLIGVDSTAWVKIYGKSEITYKSQVSEIAKRNREEVPTEMSNMAGGEIASKPDKKTGSAKPITPVYEVIIPMENPRPHARAGTARVRQDRWRHPYPGLVALAVCVAPSSTSSFDRIAKQKCRFDDREGHGVITVAVRASPVSECKFAGTCQFDSLERIGSADIEHGIVRNDGPWLHGNGSPSFPKMHGCGGTYVWERQSTPAIAGRARRCAGWHGQDGSSRSTSPPCGRPVGVVPGHRGRADVPECIGHKPASGDIRTGPIKHLGRFTW